MGALRELSRNAIQEMLKKKSEMETRKKESFVSTSSIEEDLTDDINLDTVNSVLPVVPKSRKRLVKKAETISTPGEIEDLSALMGNLSLQKKTQHNVLQHQRYESRPDSPETSESFHSAQSDEEEDEGDDEVFRSCDFSSREKQEVDEQTQFAPTVLPRASLEDSSADKKPETTGKGKVKPEKTLSQGNVESCTDLTLDGGRFHLPGKLAGGLYPHQREGISWLWTLHKAKKGGILGDDMVSVHQRINQIIWSKVHSTR